jgi:hypothetical protein
MTCKCVYPTTNCQNIDTNLYCCNKCDNVIMPFKKVNKQLTYKFRTSISILACLYYLKAFLKGVI